MYDFLRRPMWILSHVLIALLVLALIGLGLWQRARWIEESDKAERLEQRAQFAPLPYEDAVDPTADPAAFDPELRFTRVEATGVYDTDAEVAILNRSQNGAPGAWVLTPLVTAEGTAVPVLRGWIPLDPTGEAPPFRNAEPPDGEVTVSGTLQPTQERGGIGAIDDADGTLESLARVDLARLAEQLPYPLGPAWVLLDDQQPPPALELPQQVELLTDDPSQNFSYMVQWWIFAVIALLGYPLVLRGVARHRSTEVSDGDELAERAPTAPPRSEDDVALDAGR